MTDLTPAEIKQAIKTEVTNLGFLLNGFTTPAPLAGFEDYQSWINAGYNADMHYLARPSAMEKRLNPKLIVPEVKTILVLGIPYPTPVLLQDDSNLRKIAAYAQGPDYHDLIPKRLSGFSDWLHNLIGNPINLRIFTDTAPIMEKELGVRAGLGWIGRNGLLINPDYGSFFFLTEIFLDLELPADLPFEKDFCGKCNRCVEYCPTNCILPNRQLDSSRCLSYLTIEKRGKFTEQESNFISDSVFGCDICQIVCPWNQKRMHADQNDLLFTSNNPLKTISTHDLLLLDDKTFRARYKHTPISRTKRKGLIRNILASISNTGQTEDLELLKQFIFTEENENLRMMAIHAQVNLAKRLEK